jgi:carboxymethylenebutenolidase
MRTTLLSLLLVACSSSSPKQQPPTPTGSATPESQLPIGSLSEEQFKALHNLPADQPTSFKGEEIDLAGSRAYLSLPSGTGPFPGIVVIHEWWGLDGHIKHYTDRLAAAGWAALAVDLYGGVVATDKDAALKAVKSVDNAKASATIHEAINFLSTDARVKAPKRAVIGWCFGGGWSLQTALSEPELDGAIIYYGRLETDPAKLGAIKARVMGVFGNQDEGIPPPEVNKFEAALKTAKVDAQIYRYDAPHAFANPSNPKYNEQDAADAWSHVVAFLDSLKR